LKGLPVLLPITTIELITNSDVLYDFRGYMKGIDEGISASLFHTFFKLISPNYKIYGMNYNGCLEGITECRAAEGFQETHVVWFTKSKRKRVVLIQAFLKQNKDKLKSFVTPEESSGYFYLAKIGLLNYVGKFNDMNVFESWQYQQQQ